MTQSHRPVNLIPMTGIPLISSKQLAEIAMSMEKTPTS